MTLAALKGAAAVAAGSGSLLAQAGYTAAEAVLLSFALTVFKAREHAGKKLRRRGEKTGENSEINMLVVAFLIFSGGCTLLWTGYSLPFKAMPAIATQTFYFAALLILCAEVILWRWILAGLKRRHSPVAFAAGASRRKDLLLLVAALFGALAARYGFPAADMLVSAAIAMLILLQALNLGHSALSVNGVGS